METSCSLACPARRSSVGAIWDYASGRPILPGRAFLPRTKRTCRIEVVGSKADTTPNHIHAHSWVSGALFTTQSGRAGDIGRASFQKRSFLSLSFVQWGTKD